MTDPVDLDPGYLLELSGGDAELIGEIVEIFREDVPPRIDELATAVGAGDMGGVARIAHSLKGAAGSLGADRLQALALEIEEAAKADNAAGCASLLETIREALATLMARLDSETWVA